MANFLNRIKDTTHRRKLRFDIVTSFLVLFIASSVFILVYTYQGTKASSIDFAQKLLEQMTETIVEKTSNYLGDAHVATTISESFIKPQDPKFMEDESLRLSFMQVLKLNPNFKVVQIALKNGNYFSMERVNQGTKYVKTPDKSLQENIQFLSQHQDRSNPTHPIEIWTYYDDEGRIVSKEENEFLVYDARKRPWYMRTEQKMKFNWSSVYNFSFINVPGVTASKPLYASADNQGENVGVVGIDLSLQDISHFLQKNKVSTNGSVIVLNAGDQLVASSNPRHLVATDARSEEIITIDSIKDNHIKEAHRLFQENNTEEFRFDYQNISYLASFTKLPDETDNYWLVGIVVPIDDFLGTAKSIRDNVFFMILLSLVISTMLIYLLSRRISRPIVAVAGETQKIQNLDIDGDFHLKSSILEIQLMLSSLASMKNSLASFSKFVPKSLVRKLLQKGGEVKLGGKKKELTIFFSDIANFTNISETMSPEKLVMHLSTYLDELSRIITESSGTIDKYIGDAIMAFWGAPINDRDQTFHACHAALSCQRKLVELNRQWELEDKPIFHTRMGLHRDEVLVGIIGSQEKMNYTVMGDGVNAASRLEGLNKAYGTFVLVSERVVEEVEESFLFRPLDIITVKGKKKPFKIFELMAQNKGDASLLPSESERQLSLLFTKAFRLYTIQKFDEALTAFEELHAIYPHDYPTTLYIERCKELKLNPPPLDWDGVTVFTHK
ncbi:MAG: adenylate/guanylate cyclase domain-containing protein [Alphaproteobacteria bacterium]|nr:adenylate/guanylate cyclase domain-containing protein [Alphaproteobacteria bacterium]